MSIRHQELDRLVDGAWLRNVHVSSGAPHGDIDRLVHQRTREQLTELASTGEVVEITLYQSGFAPALMGFYRGAVEHLVEHPSTLRVVPRYFSSSGYREGTPWPN
jgi:hypothetical protein